MQQQWDEESGSCGFAHAKLVWEHAVLGALVPGGLSWRLTMERVKPASCPGPTAPHNGYFRICTFPQDGGVGSLTAHTRNHSHSSGFTSLLGCTFSPPSLWV